MREVKEIFFFQPDEEHREAMHALRWRVYTHRGYLKGNGDEHDIDHLDPHSVHFVAMAEGRVVGTIRLIRSSCGLFPTEENFELESSPFVAVARFQVVEISRLAVESPRGYPPHAILFGLIKTIFSFCMEKEWIYWYLAADEQVFRMLRHFHFAVNQLGPAKVYMGSSTIPAFINIREGIRFLRAKDPEMAAFLMDEECSPKYAWYKHQAAS